MLYIYIYITLLLEATPSGDLVNYPLQADPLRVPYDLVKFSALLTVQKKVMPLEKENFIWKIARCSAVLIAKGAMLLKSASLLAIVNWSAIVM